MWLAVCYAIPSICLIKKIYFYIREQVMTLPDLIRLDTITVGCKRSQFTYYWGVFSRRRIYCMLTNKLQNLIHINCFNVLCRVPLSSTFPNMTLYNILIPRNTISYYATLLKTTIFRIFWYFIHSNM